MKELLKVLPSVTGTLGPELYFAFAKKSHSGMQITLIMFSFGSFVTILTFPCGSVGKESACNAGHLGLIPGLGRSSGEGNGNPLKYSCLDNPMDRGVWRAAVHEVVKSWT